MRLFLLECVSLNQLETERYETGGVVVTGSNPVVPTISGF